MAWSFGKAFKGLFSSARVIEAHDWDDLEDTLLRADFGPTVTEETLAAVHRVADASATLDTDDLRRILGEVLEERLAKFDPTLNLKSSPGQPAVVLVVGVNGVGKTTTIGKFAKFIATRGKRVIVGAADTFRAAAVEQLATWAERAGVDIVRPTVDGQDPAAVAYQTVERAIAEGHDVVIIDTAGRLHTKSGLMDELGKIKRVVEKLVPITEVLLVLDATTGQNGLNQATAFLEQAGVTGLVLTKLDGSARGGFVFAVQEESTIPVKLVGQGEGIDDLTGFTPHVFVRQLLD
jgi:fused signal recognition particle receptor